jgi:hypothetical protein
MRLRIAVIGLLRKGLIDILQTRDFNPNKPRLLDVAEAEAVLDAEENWLVSSEPGFDGSGDYFLVEPTEQAEEAFEAALAATGRSPSCDWLIE